MKEHGLIQPTYPPSLPELDTKELGGLLHRHIAALPNHKKWLNLTNITDVIYKIYRLN